MNFKNIINLFTNLKKQTSLVFIFINVFVAFLGFVRSFAFIKFFNFEELGTITLINTAALLIGFFQIGLINGGYRIIALQKSDSNLKTNNVIFSYFGVVTIFLISMSAVAFLLNFINDLKILFFELLIGILMLIVNWLTNTMIGASQYANLNRANLISAISSLFCLILAYYFGLFGAIISLLIQPLTFVVIAFSLNKSLLPTKFDLDVKYIKYILSFGFIPFLAGIFILIYTQIERWSINAFLGPEALGKLYLFFLITTLWTLIPSSILNLYYPQAVRYFENKNQIAFNYIIKKSAIIVLAYCLILSMLIFFVLEQIIEYVFPKHHQFFYLITFALPGLCARTLTDPLAIFFNTIVRLKPILWSDIVSLIMYIFLLYIFYYFNSFKIEVFIFCFNLYYIAKLLLLISAFFINKSKIK